MLTGVNEIDQARLHQLLAFTVAKKKNLLTFGPAGTGKTEMAMQAVLEAGRRYVYLNLSVLEAPDLMGLPMIDKETRTTTYATPSMLPLYKGDKVGAAVGGEGDKDKPFVLLVDELDKAKPELQNPCLELIQFRTMNGRRIFVDSVIATGNLPDEHAFSQPVSHALTNRCMVYRVAPSFEPWQNWAVKSGLNSLVVGYLNREQGELLKPPPEGDETAYCHPSPRAWTNAAKDLDDAEGADLEFQTLLVAGRVGTAAALKFRVWLDHYRHIEPMINDLVQKGTRPPPNLPTDRGMICALSGVSAIQQHCRKLKAANGAARADLEKQLEKMVPNVFGWVKDLPSDYIVMALKAGFELQTLTELKLTRFADLMSAFSKVKDVIK